MDSSSGKLYFAAFADGANIGSASSPITFLDLQNLLSAKLANTIGILVEFYDTEFFIDSITVEGMDAPTPVPIPAALPLLLSGVAGLGFASRRKKKA